MVIKERQAGGMVLEVILALTLLMLVSAHALPLACKFYRQAAVEYEAEQLLAAIRYCQQMSRTTADSAWGYGAMNATKRSVFLQLAPQGNQIFAGERDIVVSNHYLPGVKAVKIYQDKGADCYDDHVVLAFNADGRPKSISNMMTILIYYQGYPLEGQKIMVSKGGRIRMERGTGEK